MRMLKKATFLLAAASVMLLSGCTDMVNVSQQEVGTVINGETGDYKGLYRNRVMKINNFCGTTDECDKALVLTIPTINAEVPGKYAMPKSNDQDLTLDLELRVSFDLSGSEEDILKRIASAAKRYKMNVKGKANEVQLMHINIDTIAGTDLNPAVVKTHIRPLLTNYTLETAFQNIGNGGSLLYGGKDPMGRDIKGILGTLREYLKGINSPLVLEQIGIKAIDMPASIKDRKADNEALTENEEMQRKQLMMAERRRVQEHLLNMRQAADELEILAAYAPILMQPGVVQYKWTQVAQGFKEAGIPFAVTPEMLAMGENGAVAVEDIKARIKSLRKSAERIENSAYYRCVEAGKLTPTECSDKYGDEDAEQP